MASTGISGLDEVLTGLQMGDNVVWQVDTIENYIEFVRPFVAQALEDRRRIVYIRFSRHQPVIDNLAGVTAYSLDPAAGFESFSTQLNAILTREGEDVFYVFDCLSDLLSVWSNDLMIGNFFKITCPYLYDLNTIAYFAILRNRHSFKTVARIRDITQLLIDVYFYDGEYYVHPLKVWNRYSPTMFLPHIREDGRYVPIANSFDAARLFSNTFSRGMASTRRQLDAWDQIFIEAGDILSAGDRGAAREQMVDRICRLVIGREERMLDLARRYLTLEDLQEVKARMIGTGFIGGKSVGMLVARNILRQEKFFEGKNIIEPHDSFYIGSDVFYTYIVENNWWQARMEQRTPAGYFEVARTLKQKLLTGSFPSEIKAQFREMMEYFGQAPIIVRSSSLLEDSFGNAFAGKYDSVFLANQGTLEERYRRFVDAVRQIYASTMNEDALVYRRQRGLDQMDEQMALLVQRVSGAYHGPYFLPDAAGVGISYNTFVWKESMDPKAGMLRLVAGLGTRAVNRVEGDYPRIVALDEPLLKCHAGSRDAQRFSQHEVDLLNVQTNVLETVSVRELLRHGVDLKWDIISSVDEAATAQVRERGGREEIRNIGFDVLLSQTEFVRSMQTTLKTLEAAYGYPVDVEFTLNFQSMERFQMNILQCRPVKTKGLGHRVSIPRDLAPDRVVFQFKGNFLGGNIIQEIRRVVYVDPAAYSALAGQSEKYDVARAVGVINRMAGSRDDAALMLLGPGRWGTSTPSLGVPVSFAEINNAAVLGELAFSGGGVMPELSFGTHFFQDLVETGIFYVAIFDGRDGVRFNREFFTARENQLSRLAPDYAGYADVVRVVDLPPGGLKVAADIVSQDIVCFCG